MALCLQLRNKIMWIQRSFHDLHHSRVFWNSPKPINAFLNSSQDNAALDRYSSVVSIQHKLSKSQITLSFHWVWCFPPYSQCGISHFSSLVEKWLFLLYIFIEICEMNVLVGGNGSIGRFRYLDYMILFHVTKSFYFFFLP